MTFYSRHFRQREHPGQRGRCRPHCPYNPVIGLYRFGSPLRITVVGAIRQPSDDSRTVPDSLLEKHHPHIVMRCRRFSFRFKANRPSETRPPHVATVCNDPTSVCCHDVQSGIKGITDETVNTSPHEIACLMYTISSDGNYNSPSFPIQNTFTDRIYGEFLQNYANPDFGFSHGLTFLPPEGGLLGAHGGIFRSHQNDTLYRHGIVFSVSH